MGRKRISELENKKNGKSESVLHSKAPVFSVHKRTNRGSEEARSQPVRCALAVHMKKKKRRNKDRSYYVESANSTKRSSSDFNDTSTEDFKDFGPKKKKKRRRKKSRHNETNTSSESQENDAPAQDPRPCRIPPLVNAEETKTMQLSKRIVAEENCGKDRDNAVFIPECESPIKHEPVQSSVPQNSKRKRKLAPAQDVDPDEATVPEKKSSSTEVKLKASKHLPFSTPISSYPVITEAEIRPKSSKTKSKEKMSSHSSPREGAAPPDPVAAETEGKSKSKTKKRSASTPEPVEEVKKTTSDNLRQLKSGLPPAVPEKKSGPRKLKQITIKEAIALCKNRDTAEADARPKSSKTKKKKSSHPAPQEEAITPPDSAAIETEQHEKSTKTKKSKKRSAVLQKTTTPDEVVKETPVSDNSEKAESGSLPAVPEKKSKSRKGESRTKTSSQEAVAVPKADHVDPETEERPKSAKTKSKKKKSSHNSSQEEATQFSQADPAGTEIERETKSTNIKSQDAASPTSVKELKPTSSPIESGVKKDSPQNPTLSSPETDSTRYEILMQNPNMVTAAFSALHRTTKVTPQPTCFNQLRRGRSGDEPVAPIPMSDDLSAAEKSSFSEPNTPPSQEEDGMTMVNSIIDRYKTSKKKALAKNSKNRIAAYDSSDEEYLLIQDDDMPVGRGSRDADTGGSSSDFVRYCVPRYELKKKLCDAHYNVIKNMSGDSVGALCKEILPDLIKIREGVTFSKRHDIFKNVKKYGIIYRALRDLTVAEPFNSGHEYKVLTLIQDRFSTMQNLMENNAELVHYIGNVLVPEALIRIFAKANGIDLDLAEKELRFKGAYDGDFPLEYLEAVGITREEAAEV